MPRLGGAHDGVQYPVTAHRGIEVGGTHSLSTAAGDFTFKFYRIDAVKDEDIVYIYALYRGHNTFRFRLSLSGTLASMLRSRPEVRL